MSVDKKERAMLQQMWEKAEVGGNADLPDGTYQFVVLKKSGDGKRATGFAMSGKGKPTFKTQLKVKGGAEEYVGQELEINDNLETDENMGWFKKKLNRLNITLPEDFEEIIDGSLAGEMAGKVFEGQVKTKNDFLNVYVNRLIGESDEESAAETEDEDEEEGETEETAEGTADIEEGTEVVWGDKSGKVIEVLDDGKVRVKTEDGKVYRKDKADLTVKAEEAAEETGEDAEEEEESEESEASDEFEVPDPDTIEEMSSGDVKKALKELGFVAADIKNPRGVLHAFCILAHDAKAKLELTEISPLSAALGLAVKKGENIKVVLTKLSAAVQKKLG